MKNLTQFFEALKTLLVGVLLLFVSFTFGILCTVVTIVYSTFYHVFTVKWTTGLNKLGKWFYDIAHGIDQTTNVSCGPLLNKTMVTKSKYVFAFGQDVDDTLSYVIAKNQDRKTLSRFGKFWARFTEILDPGHFKKALKNKIKKDIEAKERLKQMGLWP
jgi:hypothetical protein